ncbi:hypothetical protein V0M98_17760 [Pseudomonas silesiensis]|uniref:hypothetical protein n=1 Tax=Pseudomonas silesiensis TaxID=1853130 RepID=UPI0030CF190F
MGTTVEVRTKEELKTALEQRVDRIIIMDDGLAKRIRGVKAAKKAVVVAVATGVGVTALNWWNPLGWGAGAATAGAVIGTHAFAAATGAAATAGGVSGGAVAITGIIAMAYLGTLLLVMYNDYDLEMGGKASGGIPEQGVSGAGKFSLKRREKK